jgi:hypothetical protein
MLERGYVPPTMFLCGKPKRRLGPSHIADLMTAYRQGATATALARGSRFIAQPWLPYCDDMVRTRDHNRVKFFREGRDP